MLNCLTSCAFGVGFYVSPSGGGGLIPILFTIYISMSSLSILFVCWRTNYFHSFPGRDFHDEALHRLLGCSAGRFQRLDRHAVRWNTTILGSRASPAWAWSRSSLPLSTQETFATNTNPIQNSCTRTSSTHLLTPQSWRIARLKYFV